MSKETANNELQNLSPMLRDLKRGGDGFRVPEGYFEALEDSVFSRVEAAGVRRMLHLEHRKGGLFRKIIRSRTAWAAAAVLVLVLATTWLFKTKHGSSVAATSQELSEEEIVTYVLENIHEFEAEQLAVLPAGEQILQQTEPSPVPKDNLKQTDPLDDLSEEELDILLKEMSHEELESLLKT